MRWPGPSPLNAHYAKDLGEPLVSVGLCLYRDGSDSVAWHGDRIARKSPRLGARISIQFRPHWGSNLATPAVDGRDG